MAYMDQLPGLTPFRRPAAGGYAPAGVLTPDQMALFQSLTGGIAGGQLPQTPDTSIQDYQREAMKANPLLSQSSVDLGPLAQAVQEAQIRAGQVRDPRLDMLQAQNEAKGAEAQSQLQFLQNNPSPQVSYTPMQVPDMPQTQYPTPPTRQRPQMNPLVMGLAGLASAIAPQYAGQFLGSATQGTINTANQGFGDQQLAYQQQMQQLQLAHNDALAKWNAQVQFIEHNTEGKMRAELLNASMKEKRLLEQGGLTGQASGATSLAGAAGVGGTLDQANIDYNAAQSSLENAKQDLNMAIAKNQGIAKAKDEYTQALERLYAAHTSANAKITQTIVGGQNKSDMQFNKMAGYDLPNGQHVKGTVEQMQDRLNSNETIQSAHDSTRVQVQTLKNQKLDPLVERATLDKQLGNAGTDRRNAETRLADFLKAYPTPESRQSNPALQARWLSLDTEVKVARAKEEEFNNAITDLRARTGGKGAPPPPASATPLKGNGWSLSPK